MAVRSHPRMLVVAVVALRAWQASALLALTPINNSAGEAPWNAKVAAAEVKADVDALLVGKECKVLRFQEGIDGYLRTREKGIGPWSRIAMLYAGLLDLEERSDQRDTLYNKLLEIAEVFASVFAHEVGQVEQLPMRGWPFLIIPKSKIPEFEAYQFGNIGTAVCVTAYHAALRGAHETAARLALMVAGAMHDGFLTKDLRRSKLSRQGVVVFVPEGAPKGRYHRYKKVVARCLGHPQALNHGLLVARAAIELLRAVNTINWTLAEWVLTDGDGMAVSKAEMVVLLEEFLHNTGTFFVASLEERRTGREVRDVYRGKKGSMWYMWKYQDVSGGSKCKRYGGRGGRWEDIGHGGYDADFVLALRRLGEEIHGDADFYGIKEIHVQGMLVTFLNRIVHDTAVTGQDRFACDVSGINSNDVGPMADKQCHAKFRDRQRPAMAATWLPLAIGARSLRGMAKCDALEMVAAVIPVFLLGHADFSLESARENTCEAQRWLITAKYHYYQYQQGLAEASCRHPPNLRV